MCDFDEGKGLRKQGFYQFIEVVLEMSSCPNIALPSQTSLKQSLRDLVDEIIRTRPEKSETSERGHCIDRGLMNAYSRTRRQRKSWENQEIKMLLVGVCWCGVGNWSHIHAAMGFDAKRSFTDLKDKWRNLLDPRNNARTPILFKQIAKYINEVHINAPKGSASNFLPLALSGSKPSLEETYNQLEQASTPMSGLRLPPLVLDEPMKPLIMDRGQ